MEKRTFLMFNDEHPDFYTGRIIRTEGEVKPEIWTLRVGDTMVITAGTGITRQA